VLGIKVKIQLPHDPEGKEGVATKLPDVVTFIDPKEDDRFGKITAPYAVNFDAPQQPAQQQQQLQQQQVPSQITAGGGDVRGDIQQQQVGGQ
jgi:hypothetical protein